MSCAPSSVGIPCLSDPSLPRVLSLSTQCSGQKYLTAVVKVFGPVTRNYYVRAILHAA